MTNAVKIFKGVFLVLAAIIFLYGSTTCEAYDDCRVYDAGVDRLVNSLEKSGMSVTFKEKGERDSLAEVQTTPYEYTVNFDKKIKLHFDVDNSGYVYYISIFSESANLTNYKNVAIQVLKILGMNDQQATYLFNKRNSKNGTAKGAYIDIAGRLFMVSEGPVESGGSILFIAAAK